MKINRHNILPLLDIFRELSEPLYKIKINFFKIKLYSSEDVSIHGYERRTYFLREFSERYPYDNFPDVVLFELEMKHKFKVLGKNENY